MIKERKEYETGMINKSEENEKRIDNPQAPSYTTSSKLLNNIDADSESLTK